MTGEELVRMRVAVGLTRTELGAAIGRTERSIYRYEANERPIDGPTEIALLQALRSGTFRAQAPRRQSVKSSKRNS